MIFTFSQMSIKHVIRHTFGGVGSLLLLVEAHGHLVQLLAELPSGVLLELHPGVPELDVRVETVWLQVPANGGLEVGQLVRLGVEQALQLVRPRLPLRPHGAGGENRIPCWCPPRQSEGTRRRWRPPCRSEGMWRSRRWDCGDRVFKRPRAPRPEGLPHS